MLHLGDCLDVMQGIPDGSVDAVICDPPYGTTACKWDSVIPFEPMREHLKRIVKPNGAIVGIEMDDAYFDVACDRIEAALAANPDLVDPGAAKNNP